MPSSAITQYFDATEHRPIREDLLLAIEHAGMPKVAVDCGCGAGADIDYLAARGFTVYAFDVEEEAIARCAARFRDRPGVHLSRASFSSYTFPKASLVLADASLFFCAKPEFPRVWNKIRDSLHPAGIFCGSFLGPDDTMAGPSYRADDYWPDVAVFEEDEVRALFGAYDILRFTVHRSSGTTPDGKPHRWHIVSVVAKLRTEQGSDT